MRTKAARRHQITIPEKHGKVLVEKVDENWEYVMKETKGVWRKHPAFKDLDDAVEIVNWMRGKA